MPVLIPPPHSIPAEWTTAEWDTLVAALTRRKLIGGGLALGLLTACGAATPATPTVPATRVVRDTYGNDITIPAVPQRVVVVDHVALPWVLELGVIPVAAGAIAASYNEGRDFPPPLYDLGAGQIKPYARDEPDYELISSLQPDLVIGAKFVVEGRIKDKGEGYRRIAPTVVFDSAVGPLASLREIGKILGREERATQRIKEFEEAITRAIGQPRVKSMSIATPVGDGSTFLYSEDDAVVATLVRLSGIAVLPNLRQAGASGVSVAAERLNEASGEALIILEHPTATLDANPLYTLLPAVQAGLVHKAGLYTTFGGSSGLKALQDQVAGMARFLSGSIATPTAGVPTARSAEAV